MATRKPEKRSASLGPPPPPNPRAEPGCFIVRGKAWFNEYGEMVIDESGQVVNDWELLEYGDYLFDEDDFRLDGSPRARAVPLYEMRWCPVAKAKKK